MWSAFTTWFRQYLNRHPGLANFLDLGPKPPEGSFAVCGNFVGVGDAYVCVVRRPVFEGKYYSNQEECQPDLDAAATNKCVMPGTAVICRLMSGKWKVI